MKNRLHKILFLFLPALAFPLFFFGGLDGNSSRSLKALWDTGHIIFFVLAAGGLCRLFAARTAGRSPGYVFFSLSLLILLFGLSIELAQSFIAGRSPDLFDILRNQLGGLAGFFFFCPVVKEVSPQIVRWMRVVTFLLLLVMIRPVVIAVVDEREAEAQFPLLSDFETSFEVLRWQKSRRLARVDTPVRHGSRSLQVQLSTKQYSGTSLVYFPRDWSGYQWLNFSVYNPTDSDLFLYARIHDRLHTRAVTDRFVDQFTLRPGWNDLRISLEVVKRSPAGREMVMHEIEGFGIFVLKQPRPLIIYLDYVYLSK